MAAQELTAQNFESIVTAQGITVIDFWAAWCGPCKAFAPIFAAAAERHPTVTWAKVDTEAERELAGALEIRSIPTVMVFRDGVLLLRQAGMLPAKALDEIVAKAAELDMDAVRAEIAKGQSAS